MSKLYFCNDDFDLEREYCHPHFNQLLPDDFFISILEEFAPFGNDEGWDVLDQLEEYYKKKGEKLFLLDFLDRFLKRWEWETHVIIPKLKITEVEEIFRIEEEYKYFLSILPQIIIATYFGQFKITGIVDDWLKEIMENTINQQVILTKERIRNGQNDLSKMIKVVNGESTRLDADNKMTDIHLDYLNVLNKYDELIRQIPVRKS